MSAKKARKPVVAPKAPARSASEGRTLTVHGPRCMCLLCRSTRSKRNPEAR